MKQGPASIPAQLAAADATQSLLANSQSEDHEANQHQAAIPAKESQNASWNTSTFYPMTVLDPELYLCPGGTRPAPHYKGLDP